MPRVLVAEGPGLDARARGWGGAAGAAVDLRRTDDVPGLVDAAATAPGTGRPDAIVIAPGVDGFASSALAESVATASAAGVAVVAVDPQNLRGALATDPSSTALARAGARVVYGRGHDTGRYAVEHAAWRAAWPVRTCGYGTGPDQVADLRLPRTGRGGGPAPIAMLLHGGFWYHAWERDLMDGLAVDLTRRGWATWNAEYRRVGAGGGWPACLDDVAGAIDHLAGRAPEDRLDLERVVVVGHSAGAQLALRAAARPSPGVRPGFVVGLASITDLDAARAGGVGGRSVDRLIAGAPDAHRALLDASPVAHLPLGVRQLLVHARDDPIVPVEQSRRYAAEARRSGDDVDFVELPAGGHFDLIDPRSDAWAVVAAHLEGLSRPRPASAPGTRPGSTSGDPPPGT